MAHGSTQATISAAAVTARPAAHAAAQRRWPHRHARGPLRRRQSGGPRRGGGCPQRLSGAGRRHGLEHARHDAGRPGRGGAAATRPARPPERRGCAQPWRADRSARQQRRHPLPDHPRHDRRGGRAAPRGRPAPRQGPAARLGRRLRVGPEPGRGHDPDGHPRCRRRQRRLPPKDGHTWRPC